jgi:hypothetical protein
METIAARLERLPMTAYQRTLTCVPALVGTRWSRGIGVVLWHGREPDPAHRVGTRHAVLPIRNVVGPLCLHTGVVSHTGAAGASWEAGLRR